MFNTTLYSKTNAVMDTLQMTNHFWKTAELKKEAEDLLNWGERIKYTLIEGHDSTDFIGFRNAVYTFIDKILTKPIMH